MLKKKNVYIVSSLIIKIALYLEMLQIKDVHI